TLWQLIEATSSASNDSSFGCDGGLAVLSMSTGCTNPRPIICAQSRLTMLRLNCTFARLAIWPASWARRLNFGIGRTPVAGATSYSFPFSRLGSATGEPKGTRGPAFLVTFIGATTDG